MSFEPNIRATATVLTLSSGDPFSHSASSGLCLSKMLKWKCCFTSTETVGLLGTGAQDGHLDFHTAPELCLSPSNELPPYSRGFPCQMLQCLQLVEACLQVRQVQRSPCSLSPDCPKLSITLTCQ